MYVLLIVIHLLTAFVMVGAILLQSGKGAEIGATFGGSSQTIFGGRGAATFLTKFTWGCVVVFMFTSLGLAILSKQRSVGTSLKLPAPPAVDTPAEPAASSSTSAPPGTSAAPGGHEGMATAPSPAAPAPSASTPASSPGQSTTSGAPAPPANP